MGLIKDMIRKPCHDCGCHVGDNHTPGCDMERCPKCNGQLISCDCFVKDDKFDEVEFEKYSPEKWSGIMYEDIRKICEDKDLYCYWSFNTWVECDINHPEAIHDINAGIKFMNL